MENNYLKLSDILTGEECVVVKVHGHGSFRNRIVEMGFVKGRPVEVILHAPLKDPM
jgi:ferrous iron transport protein B